MRRVEKGIGGIREAEESREAKRKATNLLKREAEEKMKDLVAAQMLGIAGYVLAYAC